MGSHGAAGGSCASWTTGAVQSLPVAEHHAAVATLLGLEFGPLVGGKDGADAEEHSGVSLFKLGAGLGGSVDLGEDLVGVGWVGGKHGFELDLLFFDGGLEVDELETALLEDVVHALLLIGCDSQLLNDVWVLPPHSGRTDAKAGVHAIVGSAVLIDHLPGLIGGWRWCRGVGLLGDDDRSQEERNEGCGEDGGTCHISSFGMKGTGL